MRCWPTKVNDMGVLLQAFYWDAPSIENKEAKWWQHVTQQMTSLAADGFTALWLPPPSKAANWKSMGYDPYDYFDLGEFNQKGKKETFFGSKSDLSTLIQTAHHHHIQVYADVVINHNSGADATEVSPIDGMQRWTKFTPASQRFPRDWTCFHPSSFETMDGFGMFGGMPDLCHRSPVVYSAMMEFSRWLIETIGFDGFRFDFVKGYGPWLVKGIAEYRYVKNNKPIKPFCVGECWDSDRTIDDWLQSVNSFTDNPVSAFDFPLHYRIKQLCDGFGFDLRELCTDTVLQNYPDRAVTFVDNHDTVRDAGNSVINEKILGYAVVLTHQGYPSVFWQDYFNFGLAQRGSPNGIAALITVHEKYAGGDTVVLYADHDLYIMQRTGFGTLPGLIFVLNNRGDQWSGQSVISQWKNKQLKPVAWYGADKSKPDDKLSDSSGQVDIWAAPRGYAVYVAT